MVTSRFEYVMESYAYLTCLHN